MNMVRKTHPALTRFLVSAILVVMVVPPMLRMGPTVAAANGAEEIKATEQVFLLVGRSAVIRSDRAITRVSLSTPDIADALVTSAHELLVHGKAPGTISLLVWTDNGRITAYEIAVRRDLSALEGQIRRQFPQEPIAVTGNGKDVVLSGVVSTKYVIDRAASLAVGYVDKADNVVNLLRQQESTMTNQVMLKVRFAEVSRSAMQELGASYFTGPNGKGDWIGRATTQQYAAPIFQAGEGLVFSDFLNLFAFNTEEQLGVAIKALKGRGLFESLAEPNLITSDGKEASFLAGGEYPYPVVQGGGANASVTIVFKEFGVRLRFTPTITSGDSIHLKVMPEVSTLDFTNAVVLEGFRVPALSTRRTDTEVELRDGQTFAIAGLIDRSVNESLRRVPGIGDIPILGYLFRSQAYQKNNTELVVMITPHIVRRDSPGVTPNLPGYTEPFLGSSGRTIPAPAPAFSTPTGAPMPAPARSVVTAEPAPPAAMPAATAPRAAETRASRQAPKQAPRAAAPAATAPEPVAAAPAAMAEVTVPTRANGDDRKAAERAVKELAKRNQELAEQQKKQNAVAAREARVAAKVDAIRMAKEQEQKQRDDKIAAKRAAEQAQIDRKRWIQQQEEAAKAKEAADKLSKEQEKIKKEQDRLAKEHADREAELAKLVSQYRKLTEGEKQTAQPAQQPEQ